MVSGSNLCKELDPLKLTTYDVLPFPHHSPVHHLGGPAMSPHMTKSCLQPNTCPCSEKEIPFILKFQNTPRINTDVQEHYQLSLPESTYQGAQPAPCSQLKQVRDDYVAQAMKTKLVYQLGRNEEPKV